MLTKQHRKLYDAFYESTHNNEFLDRKTEVLVGLSTAIALNCEPCIRYYLDLARHTQISKGEISEVLAKVMAVSAGQKRLQMKDAVERFGVNLDSFQG